MLVHMRPTWCAYEAQLLCAEPGAELLPGATPYALAALSAAAAPLRRLGCKQLGRWLCVSPGLLPASWSRAWVPQQRGLACALWSGSCKAAQELRPAHPTSITHAGLCCDPAGRAGSGHARASPCTQACPPDAEARGGQAGAVAPEQAAAVLLGALADADTGVAVEADASLAAAGAAEHGAAGARCAARAQHVMREPGAGLSAELLSLVLVADACSTS